MTSIEQEIFEVSEGNFEQLALSIFEYQYQHVPIYQNFVTILDKKAPSSLEEIPFLPIEFFKSHEVINPKMNPETVFLSSGTGNGQRSRHPVANLDLYQTSFTKTYEDQIGKPSEQVILALLPNYLEQGQSSLVYMVDRLIQQSNHPLSGFYKDNNLELIRAYQEALKIGKQVVLFGVSYALLDLAELKPNLSQAVIIETGGMKGRREELSKEALHVVLKEAFNCTIIHSEYGMTELLSQAYSGKSGCFHFPNWMKISIRDVNDPFSYRKLNKTGGINVIDLANLYSCSFIATQDLGQLTEAGLKLMGRFDNTDIRGCNLLVE